MKARIKATGEIVDLECCELLDDEERRPRTRQEYNREVSTHATCNWVEVRNQAAIAAMQGMLSCGEGAFSYDGVTNEIAKSAVDQADALVKQLKGE